MNLSCLADLIKIFVAGTIEADIVPSLDGLAPKPAPYGPFHNLLQQFSQNQAPGNITAYSGQGNQSETISHVVL